MGGCSRGLRYRELGKLPRSPHEVTDRLKDRFGTIEEGLSVLASQLNSEDLDLWSKAWAANNNVNNYEIETLPSK